MFVCSRAYTIALFNCKLVSDSAIVRPDSIAYSESARLVIWAEESSLASFLCINRADYDPNFCFNWVEVEVIVLIYAKGFATSRAVIFFNVER